MGCSMLFKNVRVYKLNPEFNLTLGDLEEAVAKKPARECQNLETEYLGFDYVFPGSRLRVYPLENERILYLRLSLAQRICPASVINDQAAQRIRKFEKQRGEPVRKKEKKEIKEQIKTELLSKAFQKKSPLQVIVDLDNHQVWVDQTSNKKAEAPLSLVRKVLNSFPVTPISADVSFSPIMKAWVAGDIDLPEGLTLGTEAKLVDQGDEKAQVAVKFEDLSDQDILALLPHRTVVELGLEIETNLAFKLQDDFTIKGIKPLIKPEPIDSDNPADQFDAALYLTWAEIRSLTRKLLQANEMGADSAHSAA